VGGVVKGFQLVGDFSVTLFPKKRVGVSPLTSTV
jgi:hypothetical protein